MSDKTIGQIAYEATLQSSAPFGGWEHRRDGVKQEWELAAEAAYALGKADGIADTSVFICCSCGYKMSDRPATLIATCGECVERAASAEIAKVVAWLRSREDESAGSRKREAKAIADALERGEHKS